MIFLSPPVCPPIFSTKCTKKNSTAKVIIIFVAAKHFLWEKNQLKRLIA
jgi:hypothetical protein